MAIFMRLHTRWKHTEPVRGAEAHLLVRIMLGWVCDSDICNFDYVANIVVFALVFCYSFALKYTSLLLHFSVYNLVFLLLGLNLQLTFFVSKALIPGIVRWHCYLTLNSSCDRKPIQKRR